MLFRKGNRTVLCMVSLDWNRKRILPNLTIIRMGLDGITDADIHESQGVGRKYLIIMTFVGTEDLIVPYLARGRDGLMIR